MALNSATYYSNGIQGQPMAGADVNIFDTHSAPKYAAGYLVERSDGSRFRYCHVGTATNAGNDVILTQDINLVEFVICPPELLMYVHEEDLVTAHQTMVGLTRR